MGSRGIRTKGKFIITPRRVGNIESKGYGEQLTTVKNIKAETDTT